MFIVFLYCTVFPFLEPCAPVTRYPSDRIVQSDCSHSDIHFRQYIVSLIKNTLLILQQGAMAYQRIFKVLPCFQIFQRVFRTSTKIPTPWFWRYLSTEPSLVEQEPHKNVFKGHGSHTVISTACENSIALQLAKHKSFGSPNAKCNRLKIRARKNQCGGGLNPPPFLRPC